MEPTKIEELEIRIEQSEKLFDELETYTHWLEEKFNSHLHKYHHSEASSDSSNCTDCQFIGAQPLSWGELF